MNRSNRIGTAWATAITTYLIAQGWPHAERRALHGANDRGDIAGIPGVVIEAKSQNRHSLAEWLDEASVEKRNAAAEVSVVWFKRRGKSSAGAGYVLMDGDTFTHLLRQAGW